MRHILTAGALLFVGTTASAQTLDEARRMYLDGDYASALPVFEKAIAAKPKDPALNQWVGVCLLRTGHPDKADKYLRFAEEKKVAEAPLYLAEAAFDRYDYAEADDMLNRYYDIMTKGKKTPSHEADDLRRRILLGQSMLDRIEKIVIIDSINVDRDEFFKAYRLSPESGTLNSTDILPDDMETADPSEVYIPQSGEFRIWSAPDSAENYVLMSATRLIDGTWDAPRLLGKALSTGGGDSNYPFMMPDGVTLYYANNGPESLGGYDIFISRKDDSGFLQPQNVGMPYNSPYDDYLLAIDEVNGVGWWATDRNRLDDKITIYRFIPSELRVNYSVDTPNLPAMARIDSYRATWPKGADYTELLRRLDSVSTRPVKPTGPDFYFALPGNRIVTSWDELPDSRTREAMEAYLAAVADLDAKLADLADMRRAYAAGDRADSSRILSLEQEVERLRADLKRLSNSVVQTYGESR